MPGEFDVAAAIIGATRPEQIDENGAASEPDGPAALFGRATVILAEPRRPCDESDAASSG